jgi:hypothetical protein
MRLFLFQEGVHVLSPEEQYKWLKAKEEACSSGISSSSSAPTGEPHSPVMNPLKTGFLVLYIEMQFILVPQREHIPSPLQRPTC